MAFRLIQVDIDQVGQLAIQAGHEKADIVERPAAVPVELAVQGSRLDVGIHAPAGQDGFDHRGSQHFDLPPGKVHLARRAGHSQEIGKTVPAGCGNRERQSDIVKADLAGVLRTGICSQPVFQELLQRAQVGEALPEAQRVQVIPAHLFAGNRGDVVFQVCQGMLSGGPVYIRMKGSGDLDGVEKTIQHASRNPIDLANLATVKLELLVDGTRGYQTGQNAGEPTRPIDDIGGLVEADLVQLAFQQALELADQLGFMFAQIGACW